MCRPYGTLADLQSFPALPCRATEASGNSPLGIKRLELCVDGTKRAQILNDQLLTTLTLSVGMHQVTVVAVDQYIGIAKTTR